MDKENLVVESQRLEFEKWANVREFYLGRNTNDGSYDDPETHDLWCAYQAGIESRVAGYAGGAAPQLKDERAEFEKWATTSRTEGMFWTRKSLARDEDIYYEVAIQFAWEAWQARPELRIKLERAVLRIIESDKKELPENAPEFSDERRFKELMEIILAELSG